MRVLLVNSNRYHHPWPVMPLGLCSVAASLEAAGHEVRLLDLCFARRPAREIAQAVAEGTPQVVGVSVRNIDNCVGTESRLVLDPIRSEVTGPLRRVFAGPIVAGGCALGVSAARILSALDLDIAVRGDGEQAMTAVVDRLEHGAPLSGIPGLVLRQKGRTVEDNPPQPPADLDALPWPRVHRYVDVPAYRRFRSPLQIQSKRGCALECAYCTYNRIEGRSYRLRDPQRIADEIADMVAATGVRHVEFVDSTFNIPLDHAKAVLRAIRDRSLGLELRTMGLNPGAMDEELVDLMVEAGFRDVDLGAESGSDPTLAGLAKSFRREDLLRVGRLLRGRGIAAQWFMILGGPNETEETALETFATMDEVAASWDVVGFNVGVRVYDGSPLAERMRRETPGCTADDFLTPVFYRPEGIPLEALRALARREVARRPNFMLYDEMEFMPDWSTRALVLAFDLLRLRAPLWKAYVAMRKVGQALGRPFRRAPLTPARR